MSKVMIICGGENQIPLLRRAKEMGHIVLNTNLYEDSPAFKYADEHEILNVLDREGNLKFAKKHNVDAVISEQSEISVRTAAFVSEKLGLPSISTDIAELFTNKKRMRDFQKANGFPYPEYRVCRSTNEALAFLDSRPGKAIVKPTYSHSSRGVFSVNGQADIIRYYSQARNNSLEEDQSVIIESYLEGTEFTVDAIVLNGEVFNLAISEKRHFENNENVAQSLRFSYENERFDYDDLRKWNTAILKASGIPFGLTHSEYKYCNGRFYLIEMAARGGGAYIASAIVPYLSGIDNYNLYIQSALGNKLFDTEAIRETILNHSNRVATLSFIETGNYGKRVTRIHGLDCIRKQKNILMMNLSFHEGDLLRQATDDSTRQGYFIAMADSQDSLEEAELYASSRLIIEVENDSKE